jgi:hypothetical protein
MNTTLLASSFAIVLSLSAARAADDVDHSAHQHGSTADNSGPSQDGPSGDVGLGKIREIMERMRSTTDAKERDALMKEHLEALRESLKSMRAIKGKGGMDMKGGGKKDEGGAEKADHQHGDDTVGAGAGKMEKGGKGDGMMMGGMMKMHKKMEDRMDALQTILEQLVEHEVMERELEGK